MQFRLILRCFALIASTNRILRFRFSGLSLHHATVMPTNPQTVHLCVRADLRTSLLLQADARFSQNFNNGIRLLSTQGRTEVWQFPAKTSTSVNQLCKLAGRTSRASVAQDQGPPDG